MKKVFFLVLTFLLLGCTAIHKHEIKIIKAPIKKESPERFNIYKININGIYDFVYFKTNNEKEFSKIYIPFSEKIVTNEKKKFMFKIKLPHEPNILKYEYITLHIEKNKSRVITETKFKNNQFVFVD